MRPTRITAERPILAETRGTSEGTEILVRKMPNDPLCLRISIGGTKDGGYYVVYRGDESEVEACLKAALDVFSLHRIEHPTKEA